MDISALYSAVQNSSVGKPGRKSRFSNDVKVLYLDDLQYIAKYTSFGM